MNTTSQTLEGYLHDFRKEIDVNIKKSEEYLGRETLQKDCKREMALTHTKLQEAKMWVGKCLEAIGSEFPEELRDEGK